MSITAASFTTNLSLFSSDPRILGGDTFAQTYNLTDLDPLAQVTNADPQGNALTLATITGPGIRVGFVQDVNVIINAMVNNYAVQTSPGPFQVNPRAVMYALWQVLGDMLGDTPVPNKFGLKRF